jgi:hypothetical protein
MALMADQDDRREESLGTDETRYERELEAEQRRSHEAAERLKDEPLPEPADE